MFVVGNNSVILRYDGLQWRRMDAPPGYVLFDIWGIERRQHVRGRHRRHDPALRRRRVDRHDDPGADEPVRPHRRAFNDIYAVGNAGACWHFDGSTWRVVDIGTSQNLRGITRRRDGIDAHGRMVGHDRRPCAVSAPRCVGTTEISDPSLLSVWSAPNGPTFAAGLGGAIFRRDGAAWTPQRVPGANDLYGISGSSASDIIAVGDTGSILRFDGSAWTRDASPTTRLLRAVWSGGAGQSVIVGERGTILRANGGPWVPQASGTTQFLRAVWGSDPANVYVVGDSGMVLRFDGGRWNELGVPVPNRRRLRAVWGTAATNVYIAGDSGTILRFDGVQWTTQAVPTMRDLRALWGRGPTELYAAGDSGTVLRFDGQSWAAMSTPITKIIYALFGIGGTAQVAAVGEAAKILEGVP